MYSWKNAITAKGINADVINAGTINTKTLNIMNGDQPNFKWDRNGIVAYVDKENIDDINEGQRGVVFNQFGLYGYNASSADGMKAIYMPTTSADLINSDNVNFALTWDGLSLKHKISEGAYQHIVLTANSTQPFTITNNGTDVFYLDENGITVTGVLHSRDFNGQTLFKVDASGSLTAIDSKVGLWNIKNKFIYPDNKAVFLYGGKTNEIPDTWQEKDLFFDSIVNTQNRYINYEHKTIYGNRTLSRLGDFLRKSDIETRYFYPGGAMSNAETNIIEEDINTNKTTYESKARIKLDNVTRDYYKGSITQAITLARCGLALKLQLSYNHQWNESEIYFPFPELTDFKVLDSGNILSSLKICKCNHADNTSVDIQKYVTSLKIVQVDNKTEFFPALNITFDFKSEFAFESSDILEMELLNFPVYYEIFNVPAVLGSSTENDQLIKYFDESFVYSIYTKTRSYPFLWEIIEPDDLNNLLHEGIISLNYYTDEVDSLGIGITEDGGGYFKAIKTDKIIMPKNGNIYFEETDNDLTYLRPMPSRVHKFFGPDGLINVTIANGLVYQTTESGIIQFASQTSKPIYECSFDVTHKQRDGSETTTKKVTLHLCKGATSLSNYGLVGITIE